VIPKEWARQVRAMLRPVETRLANAIARAVVSRVNDSGGLQTIQLGVMAGETVDDAEHFQAYGFSSSVPLGGEAVVLFPNGDRARPLVIATGHRASRITGLEEGETAIYNADSLVILKNDGTIEARSRSGSAAEVATLESLQDLKDIFTNWVPVAQDGGAALQTALSSWTPAGTTKFKAE
jgi:phage gp45-like